MLVADRAQAMGFFGVRVAVNIVITDPHAHMTRDIVVDAGHRDAAFLMQDHLGRGPNYLRIDISPRATDGVEVEHHDP